MTVLLTDTKTLHRVCSLNRVNSINELLLHARPSPRCGHALTYYVSLPDSLPPRCRCLCTPWRTAQFTAHAICLRLAVGATVVVLSERNKETSEMVMWTQHEWDVLSAKFPDLFLTRDILLPRYQMAHQADWKRCCGSRLATCSSNTLNQAIKPY
jgi:hypothetical protein